MRSRFAWFGAFIAAGVFALSTGVGFAQGTKEEKKDRDVFNYEAQKSAKDAKRIVFIADKGTHGARGNHEFVAAAVYLARTINDNYPNAYATVHTTGNWPKDLSFADSVVVLLNHGGPAADNKHVQEAMKRGAGFVAIHYGVEVNKGNQGKNYLEWMGGYFEPFWSVNPHWTANFKDIPKHETTRGVKPFSTNDEWYYHMRFVDDMKGVTPILSDLPSVKTIAGGKDKAQSHGGNPDAYKAVEAGKAQVVAWAYERADGGRGFGFTGLHKHDNLGLESVRTLLANAVAWSAKLPVPETGVRTTPLDRSGLQQLIDDGDLAKKRGH